MPSCAEPCRAVPSRTEPFRTVPGRSEQFRAVPNRSEPCRAVPNRAKPCRAVLSSSEPCRAPLGAVASRVEPFRAVPNRSEPTRAVPSRSEPCRAGLRSEPVGEMRLRAEKTREKRGRSGARPRGCGGCGGRSAPVPSGNPLFPSYCLRCAEVLAVRGNIWSGEGAGRGWFGVRVVCGSIVWGALASAEGESGGQRRGEGGRGRGSVRRG